MADMGGTTRARGCSLAAAGHGVTSMVCSWASFTAGGLAAAGAGIRRREVAMLGLLRSLRWPAPSSSSAFSPLPALGRACGGGGDRQTVADGLRPRSDRRRQRPPCSPQSRLAAPHRQTRRQHATLESCSPASPIPRSLLPPHGAAEPASRARRSSMCALAHPEAPAGRWLVWRCDPFLRPTAPTAVDALAGLRT